jgi:hypothetical protein
VRAHILLGHTDNQQHKIRLIGIDAPESNQDYGSRAKQSLSDLVFGRVVTVTSEAKDMYGRVLGDVTLDGKNVNLEQVRRGFAWLFLREGTEDGRRQGLRPGRGAGEEREAWAMGRRVAGSALPGLLEGVGAQPRAVQDGGRSAGGWIQEGAELSTVGWGSRRPSRAKKSGLLV